jgi:hypothetical protein
MRSNTRASSGRRGDLQPRVYAALFALACLTLLAVGAGLAPDTAGHGTHTQLGLPPCAFAVALGKPCATCGMTTAVSTAASGNLTKALAVQPFGAGIAIAAASAFWISLYSAVSGSRVWKAATPLLQTRPMLVLAGLLLASWVYKIIMWNP